MNTKLDKELHEPITRQYKIGGVRYVVKATTSRNAKETAMSKINRLIKNDLDR